MRKLITLALLLIAGVASAAIQSGYYRVKSYNDKYLTENTSNHTLVCSDLSSSTSYTQVWYLDVKGSNVTFRNALTKRYVQNMTSTETNFFTDSQPFSFTLGEDGSIVTFANNNWGGLHCSNENNVVYWDVTEAKSKWTVETVAMDDAALAAQQAALLEATTEQLLAVFTDLSCSTLKSGYTTNAVNALPASAQALVTKIEQNSWATYSGWNKTEKTFRIADYKAYSSHERWTSIIGLGYSFGRLTNPTGISVSAGDIIQVYVGAIPSGQTVKLEVAGEYQASGSTYSLHEGMNSLLMASSGNCFVFYEVDNTTNGGAPYTAPSSYADVTVHIEGGTVNGYFDLTKGDTNDDWAKLQSNLLTGPCVELKTSNLLFHMHTNLVKDACPTKMVELLGEWDKILNMEYSLMGLEDYEGYWNNMFSATDIISELYMYASNYGTYYNVTTIPDVMNYENMLAGGALWGPAHENGHIFQKYINMVGQTEVSNNVFSNVAIYNNGHLTSRATNISTTFENMANNVFWNDRDIWERTHLYFQLYQFFQILGKNTNFYPELFKALRSDPMVHEGNTFISASDDYLKFYKKCCSVSGYDLTDFFQAYGFFVIPTLTSYTLNGVTKDAYMYVDYTNFYLTITQSEIDAAKQAVADMNLPKANIIFIEDRITAPDATYEGAAPGTKKTAFSEEYPIGHSGEMGQYTDFDVTPSAYTYNISGRGNVTVSGTGAVGIIVYDNSGNIVGFYNTNNFSLPASAFDENGLKSGYSIKAAAGDGTTAAATYDSGVEVNEFPKTGVWYVLVTPLREGRFTQSNGADQGMNGTLETSTTDAMQWLFVERDGEPETFDIINRDDNSYISPVPGDGNQLSTSSTQPAAGWKVGDAQTEGYHIIYSGETQLHQGSYGDNYKTLSYGYFYGSYNTTDGGCQFAIEEVKELASTALDELAGLDISVSENAADDLTTGQWYVMFDRGANHGYLYENASSHTLYNTATKPANGEVTADNAKYLVRLIDAGDGKYYIQTGYGNYFWTFKGSTNVAASAYQLEKITIDKIDGTAGHFYLRSSNNVILDANAITSGATVVGYGTSVPTSTGGNNDWAFYPVTLTRAVTLNAVGDKSYATLYLPYDVTTDGATKAYYITEVAGGYAQLTATSNEGKEIPANTAVVLINSEKATSTTLTVTNRLAQQVSESTNLLKGTLTPMELDLSLSSPYYSLGVIDKIGFYKFNNGNSTTITLGANKAYLEYTAPPGVKGFVLDFGGEDGIEPMVNHASADGKWYDLNGRRLHGTPTAKGIYIIDGKKVVVK